MTTSTRRSFLAGAGVTALWPGAKAAPLGQPIGFQVYPIREMLAQDFPGTLKQMAAMGYGSVEMCSPPGYVSSGFGPLAKLTAAEMKRIITDAGLRCDSCHYGPREFSENLDERIAFAKELGLRQMVLSSFGLPKAATLDDWRKAAGDLNTAAAKIRQAGLRCAFHNHHGEFSRLEGILIYDELLQRLDAKLVQMQFQVAVVNIGFHAADYMEKHPGRFLSLHLADWDAEAKRTAPIGKGVVDWKRLFQAAKKGGVQNYYVEMNLDLMRDSAPYLKSLSA
jgi:sugar phosphate isomerase/epimerase